MGDVRQRQAVAVTKRSPELERLIRSLDQVARDLPGILREEKRTAFARCGTLEEFEAHLTRIGEIPHQLETLSRTVSGSLQVSGATEHLSRLFRAMHNGRHEASTMPPVPQPDIQEATRRLEGTAVHRPAPASPAASEVKTASDPFAQIRIDPATGNAKKETANPLARVLDLHLDQVRRTLVPGGAICDRSMYESSRARLVTARAGGEGPWRFQVRVGSLRWAAEAEENDGRGLVALLCGDLGFVEVPARLLLSRLGRHLMRSTTGNQIMRPSVAVFGHEAFVHPGAMSRTRPGEVMKLAFVEF